MEDWRIDKSPELLPCPFCGGEAAFFDDRQHPYDTDCHIGCTKCGARIDDSELELWNKRVDLHEEANLLKRHIEAVQVHNKEIIEQLEREKLYREHIAYSLYCKDDRYLQCKSWGECLKLAEKDFREHTEKSLY